MKKIYVAGKLNDTATGYLQNVNRMLTNAEAIHKAGFAVFVPCFVVLMGVMFGDWEYDDYFDNNQPWLIVSDGVYMGEGWETSSGCRREKALADANGIPVFYGLEDVIKYFSE